MEYMNRLSAVIAYEKTEMEKTEDRDTIRFFIAHTLGLIDAYALYDEEFYHHMHKIKEGQTDQTDLEEYITGITGFVEFYKLNFNV